MSAPRRKILAAVAVSLALSVVVSSSARANGGPTRLDKATAAAVAEDLEILLVDDQSADVERCFRLGALRVDCVVEFGFDGTVENAHVVAVEIVGERLFVDFYGAEIHGYYSKANTIRVSPPGFRTRPIHHAYRDRSGIYRPEQLIDTDLGWGRPKLPELIRRQCALQPRLRCAGNFL